MNFPYCFTALVCSTGFALSAFITLTLNLILPEEDEGVEDVKETPSAPVHDLAGSDRASGDEAVTKKKDEV